jgi:hypothetical protein
LQAVERAESAAKGAEEAKQKADSEAAFAYNAKLACEGHATAIAQVKGTVEADRLSVHARHKIGAPST